MDITKYFKSGTVALFSKIVLTVSSLLIIWLATDYLGKEDFGNFIYVYSWVSILAAVTSTPFASIVLYRVSRLAFGDGRHYAMFAVMGTAIFSMFIAMIMAFSSDFFANLIEKPTVDYWFLWLGLFLPLDALRLTLASWQQAQQKTIFMMICRDILPFTLRAFFLFIVWLVSAGSFAAVIGAYVLSLIIPLGLLYKAQPLDFHDMKNPVNKWDIGYAAKSFAIQIIHRPSQNIDILLLGALAPAEVVAEYALASRLAGLLMMGKDALMPLLNPRMGKFMENGDQNSLRSEFIQARNISLALAYLGCLFFIVTGPYILMLFEGYQESFPLLMALCGTMLIRIGTGANGEYLIMRGNAGWSLIATIPAVIAGIIIGWLLVPAMDGLGAAVAVFSMVFITNVIISAYIWKRDNFVVCDYKNAVLLLLSSAALFCYAISYLPLLWLLIMIGAVTLLYGAVTLHDWKNLLQMVKGVYR